jgi:hypothetical protein
VNCATRTGTRRALERHTRDLREVQKGHGGPGEISGQLDLYTGLTQLLELTRQKGFPSESNSIIVWVRPPHCPWRNPDAPIGWNQ